MVEDLKEKGYEPQDLELFYFFMRNPRGDDIDNYIYGLSQEEED